MSTQDDRLKLIKKFWLMANSVGEEFAYDVVESLYHHRSLSRLSLAELDKTVRELQRKSNFKFKKQSQNPQNRNFFVLPRGFFENMDLIPDISTPLKKKIQALTQQSGITTTTLANLVKKMAAPNGYFGIAQAQKVIEALKNIIETGWKETGNPQRKPTTTKTPIQLLPTPVTLQNLQNKHWMSPKQGNA